MLDLPPFLKLFYTHVIGLSEGRLMQLAVQYRFYREMGRCVKPAYFRYYFHFILRSIQLITVPHPILAVTEASQCHLISSYLITGSAIPKLVFSRSWNSFFP